MTTTRLYPLGHCLGVGFIITFFTGIVALVFWIGNRVETKLDARDEARAGICERVCSTRGGWELWHSVKTGYSASHYECVCTDGTTVTVP